jgi:hypothetical protein
MRLSEQSPDVGPGFLFQTMSGSMSRYAARLICARISPGKVALTRTALDCAFVAETRMATARGSIVQPSSNCYALIANRVFDRRC